MVITDLLMKVLISNDDQSAKETDKKGEYKKLHGDIIDLINQMTKLL
jgi:hypothetical protein